MSKRVITLVAAAGLVVTAVIVASFLLVNLGAPASAADPPYWLQLTPTSAGSGGPAVLGAAGDSAADTLQADGNETMNMTPTPTSSGTSTAHLFHPFKGTPAAIPGKIEAENYDKGGQGIAWFDTTPGNEGGAYREDDVDIEKGGSGNVVAFVKSSEWLIYSVHVPENGMYRATFRASSPWDDRQIWVWVDGILEAQVKVKNTGSFDIYDDVSAEVALPVGNHYIKLEFEKDAQNLDFMSFERTGSISTWPVSGTGTSGQGTGGGGSNVTPTSSGTVTPTSTATGNATATPTPGEGGGGQNVTPTPTATGNAMDQAVADATRMVEEGRQTFRYDTFGDEAFWGGALQLHRAIEGTAMGGVGPGVSPATALAVGLKVDQDALPQSLVDQVKQGKVDLNDPNTTLALLKLNAVVGVNGTFKDNGSLESIGITCGLCHSTVDDAFAPGIGHRLDGWPNRDLNVGAIINLSPNVTPIADRLGVDETTVRTVLGSWGPGKFDAELLHDGIAFNPKQVSNGNVTGTNVSGATLLPAAFGLAGVNLHTYTGWGSVTYWNAFVAVTEMQGKGRFYDPRLNNTEKFPLDARDGTWNITPETDLVTSKLPALHFYQLSLVPPTPPEGSFDAAAAARGDDLFNGKAGCGRCHVEPLYTEPGWNMHTADEIGIDAFQANRSPDGMYRTTPLKGVFAREKGGFFHDGRFANLTAVVDHYNTHFNLGLTDQEKADVVEYVKSL